MHTPLILTLTFMSFYCYVVIIITSRWFEWKLCIKLTSLLNGQRYSFHIFVPSKVDRIYCVAEWEQWVDNVLWNVVFTCKFVWYSEHIRSVSRLRNVRISLQTQFQQKTKITHCQLPPTSWHVDDTAAAVATGTHNCTMHDANPSIELLWSSPLLY